MKTPAPRRRTRLAALAAVLGTAALGPVACVPLPLVVGSVSEGTVRDASSGQPLPGAIVVVRFEGTYDDVLPEPRVLGHREAIADVHGRFRTPRLVAPGLAPWPWLRVRTRVVAAWAPGHRCAGEPWLAEGSVRIALTPVSSRAEERSSCQSVPASLAEAPRYLEAWRRLHGPDAAAERPDPLTPPALAARQRFGFGANCRGPVVDLSLAPSGERMAVLVRSGSELEVQVASPASAGSREIVARVPAEPPARLVWRAGDELQLQATRVVPSSADGLAPGLRALAAPAARTLWRAPSPPAAVPEAPAREPGLSDPAARQDERATRLAGRSFAVIQSLDPSSGLPRDTLQVTEPSGEVRRLALPGEACREAGRFGRPHYQLARDGATGLDLRHVDGGCHALAIDLETGAWRRLDAPTGSDDAARCLRTRRLPRTQLDLALRDYAGELAARLTASGLDPASAFALRVGPDGRTVIEAVDAEGVEHAIAAPRFPVATPLERIEISVVAPPPRGLPAVEAAPDGPTPDPL